MRLIKLAFSFLAGFSVTVPAMAEVLPVGGIYPARSDAAAALRSVAIDRFGGEDGSEMSLALEDALGGAALDGTPWLRIANAALEGGYSEGLLGGAAGGEATFEDYTEEREKYVRDDKGDCTPEKRKVPVKCTRRTIALEAAVRLYDPQGTLLWSDRFSEDRTDSFCEDQDRPATFGAVVRELSARVAVRVRSAFVPQRRNETIRVNESRKGLERPLADRFKAAVRLTKSDWPGACREWEEIGAAAPSHIPTLFNRALCGEALGNDAAAETLYAGLLQLAPGNGSARDGLGRIAARRRAEAQIAAHDRP